MKRQWGLVYEDYAPGQEGLREALCTVGNGYFATRGAAPDSDADDVHYPGTYLAGGYNRLTSEIAGREIENEDLVNLPNWLPLSVRIEDGPWFRTDEAAILEYRQELDLHKGVLERALRFRDEQGRTTRWRERRFASMEDPHLSALLVELTAEDWSGRASVRSALDGTVTNDGVARYRELEGRHLEALTAERVAEDAVLLRTRTRQSRLEIVQAARTRLYRGDVGVHGARETLSREGWIGEIVDVVLERGEPLAVEKTHVLFTSRDRAISEAGTEAVGKLAEAGRFAELLAPHALAWKQLWDACDIEVDTGDHDDTTCKLRAHVFHLLQTVSRHTCDLDVGAAARGWHGEAYRGHVFWDELFIFPYLNLRMPMLTRALLEYRYRRLPEARRAARAAGYRGAMYPWQSASNGREESQRVHLNPRSGRWVPDNSHRQRHINAAVAFNVWSYFQVTEDLEFMCAHGAEMVLEIARFWASIATYDEDLDRYEIKGVMGPDEYHTAYPEADPEEHGGLDNNTYTNVMAAWCLMRAQDTLDLMPPDRRRTLCEHLGIDEEETQRWESIGRKLRVPFHDGGIISQFERYDELEEFDWKGYEERYEDIQRLDRILEAEGDDPNRYKASKQADVLMLFYLFSADELALLFERLGYRFEHDTIPRNIDYYLERTSHGSTLSRIVHAWVLARADRERAWKHFLEALDSDLADIQGGTTAEGIHLGAMAGTLDIAQRCFLGIELRGNALHLNPVLPRELARLRAVLHYRRHTLEVVADRDELSVTSRPGVAAPVTIVYRNRVRELSPGMGYTFRLLHPEERERENSR